MERVIVGIDVSKARLDVAFSTEEKSFISLKTRAKALLD